MIWYIVHVIIEEALFPTKIPGYFWGSWQG